jgi:hypothetical protein
MISFLGENQLLNEDVKNAKPYKLMGMMIAK